MRFSNGLLLSALLGLNLSACRTATPSASPQAGELAAAPSPEAESPDPGDYYWVSPEIRALLVDTVPITTPIGRNYKEDYGLPFTPPGLKAEQWKAKRKEILKLAHSPAEYERRVVIPRINGGDPNGPKRNYFAARTVLEAMRRLRRLFSVNPFILSKESKPQDGFRDRYQNHHKYVVIPDSRSISRVDYDKLKVFGGGGILLKIPFSDITASWLASLGDSELGNYEVLQSVWNEIQNHFYPLMPHRLHGCWTQVYRAAFLRSVGKPKCIATFAKRFARFAKSHPGESGRQHFLNICTGVDGYQFNLEELRECPKFLGEAVGAIPAQMWAYNHLWVDPRTNQFIEPPPELGEDTGHGILDPLPDAGDLIKVNPARTPELASVKWAKEQRAKGLVNVFDYIMLAQTWAFDWTQSQAVLAAFYGEQKTFKTMSGLEGKPPEQLEPSAFEGLDGSERNIFDPENVEDCKTYRPPLRFDKSDGTHCRLSKQWRGPGQSMVSSGR